MRRPRPVKTVVLQGSEPEIDPHLLLLDGRDVRSVSRKERRAHGFRGPVMTASAPSLTRFARRHGQKVFDFSAHHGGRGSTRRLRKARARLSRAVAARGLA